MSFMFRNSFYPLSNNHGSGQVSSKRKRVFPTSPVSLSLLEGGHTEYPRPNPPSPPILPSPPPRAPAASRIEVSNPQNALIRECSFNPTDSSVVCARSTERTWGGGGTRALVRRVSPEEEEADEKKKKEEEKKGNRRG